MITVKDDPRGVLNEQIAETRRRLAELEAAARGERCQRDDDHEWRALDSMLMLGSGVDMREFGGTQKMIGWQVWRCLACPKWAFASYGGELLRVLTEEEGRRALW